MIVKHANPCGVAVAATIEEAYERALAADPVSAFGCVLVLNRPVDGRARRADRRAVRRGAARARASTTTRSRRCARSRRCGSCRDRERRVGDAGRARLQARARRPARAGARRRRRRPRRRWRSSRAASTEEQWGDLLFAWRVCKHVELERDRAREGPADDRHRRRPDEPRRRGADRAREGARARPRPRPAPCSRATRSSRSPTARSSRSTPASPRSIQPGGSKRDDEVIAAVDGGGRGDGLHRPPPLPALTRLAGHASAEYDRRPAHRTRPRTQSAGRSKGRSRDG